MENSETVLLPPPKRTYPSSLKKGSFFGLLLVLLLASGVLGVISVQKGGFNILKKAESICRTCSPTSCGWRFNVNGTCHRECVDGKCKTVENSGGLCDCEDNNECEGEGSSCGESPTNTPIPPTVTLTPEPTATQTPTLTPRPTSTPTPDARGCRGPCQNNNLYCRSPLVCVNVSSFNQGSIYYECRNPNCVRETDCDCSISPTSTLTPPPGIAVCENLTAEVNGVPITATTKLKIGDKVTFTVNMSKSLSDIGVKGVALRIKNGANSEIFYYGSAAISGGSQGGNYYHQYKKWTYEYTIRKFGTYTVEAFMNTGGIWK